LLCFSIPVFAQRNDRGIVVDIYGQVKFFCQLLPDREVDHSRNPGVVDDGAFLDIDPPRKPYSDPQDFFPGEGVLLKGRFNHVCDHS